MPSRPKKPLQALKVLHFCSIALWMGGVAALVPVLAAVDFGHPEDARLTYLALRSIAWNVIGWGGIGTVTTGVALAAVSNWGFFRHRWVTVKLVAAPAFVVFGMFFVEDHLLDNLAQLEYGASRGLLVDTHRKVQAGLILLLCGFVGVIALSVIKPWSGTQRKEPAAAPGKGE